MHLHNELLFGTASIALVLLVGAVLAFGAKRALVAAEVFFLFGAWAALRAARLLRGQPGQGLDRFVALMAVGFGLSSGLLAAYLLLTTPEGNTITEWVTANTLRIVASLFAAVFALGFLDAGWRTLGEWIRGLTHR